MNSESKTILRYDSGAYGFRKAAFFLISLAFILAVFSVYWIISWKKKKKMNISIEYCNK